MFETEKIAGGEAPRTIEVCGITLVEVPGRDCFCAKELVTWTQWARILGLCSPIADTAELPVIVSEAGADECWRFFEKLNESQDAKRLGVSLVIPTKEEWSFARKDCEAAKKSTDEREDGDDKFADEWHYGELRADGWDDVEWCDPGSLWDSNVGLRVFAVRGREVPWWSSIGRVLWRIILEALPTVADKCDAWEEMDVVDWRRLLEEQPQFADRCDKWDEMDASDWCELLERQPQFASKCDSWDGWDSFEASDWRRLLWWRPQFADKCGKWSEMTCYDWRELLCRHPEFADKCDKWNEMSGADWAELLRKCPQFADRCDKWAEFGEEDWSRLTDEAWKCLLKARPSLAAKRSK